MANQVRSYRASFLARSKRAQALSRAANIAVRGLEALEGRTLLSTSVPISWDGQVRAAVPDEWVVKFSDSYLEQSRKAAGSGIGDEELGPFVTLTEVGGYNISDASIERVRTNSSYAILHAPFSKADAIENWADSMLQDNPVMHTHSAFESFSPYFTDLAIPAENDAQLQSAPETVNPTAPLVYCVTFNKT